MHRDRERSDDGLGFHQGKSTTGPQLVVNPIDGLRFVLEAERDRRGGDLLHLRLAFVANPHCPEANARRPLLAGLR